jgi:hypothetical protein
MKTIEMRLRRLEARLGAEPETWEALRLRARLEAARRRCGLPPPSAERLAELRGRSIVDILKAARQRFAMANRHPDRDGEEWAEFAEVPGPPPSEPPQDHRLQYIDGVTVATAVMKSPGEHQQLAEHRTGSPVLCNAPGEFLKQAPLLVPVDPAGNGPQVSLVQALDEWQK